MGQGKFIRDIKEFFSKDWKLKLIVLLGLLGMALILISQLTGKSGGDVPQEPPALESAEFVSETYIKDMEEKLQNLVGEIEGVGRNRVMVTLESGVEYVYAQEEKRSTDATREPGAELAVGGRVYEKENVEQKYILVDTEYGKKEALVLTERQPKVQGVVVVCEGADNILVQEKLISVITTALGIPSTRVCVVKIS